MNKATNADTLFEHIAQYIEASRALLSQGAIMELSGLDDHIRLLCEQVLAMPQEDRIAHADKLQYLLGELKHLGDELIVQRDLVSKEIKDTSSHKKATTAYSIADSRDEYGKKDG